MPKDAHELLAAIADQHTVAQHALDRLGTMIGTYRDTFPDPRTESMRGRVGPKIKSLTAWVDWLKEHGPAYRQDVWDGTGLNLAAGAAPHVRKWKEHMEMWSNQQIPSDSLLTISGPRATDRKGRPPVIYFLWSQRYDLLPTFGVGPDGESQSNEPEPAPMTGVIQPPDGVSEIGWGARAAAYVEDIGEIGFDMDKAREQMDLTPTDDDGTIYFIDTKIFDGCCDWTGGDDANRHAAYHRMKGLRFDD